MSAEEVLRRIATGIRRPINAAPVPTAMQVYNKAEREGIAVSKANRHRVHKS